MLVVVECLHAAEARDRVRAQCSRPAAGVFELTAVRYVRRHGNVWVIKHDVQV